MQEIENQKGRVNACSQDNSTCFRSLLTYGIVDKVISRENFAQDSVCRPCKL